MLTHDEKELGVALVDIGGGTTDLAIFERGACGTPASCRSAAITSPTTSPSGCARRFPSREAEAQVRLRAVVDGGRGRDHRGGERGRPQAAPDGAPHPVRDPAAARRGDLPPGVGRDPARRLREVAELGHRADRRRLDLEGMPEIAEQIFDLPIRRGCPVGVGGLADHVDSPGLRRRSAWCCTRTATGARTARGRRRRVRLHGGRLRGIFKEFF